MVTLIAPGRWSFRLRWRFIKAIATTRGLVRKEKQLGCGNGDWTMRTAFEPLAVFVKIRNVDGFSISPKFSPQTGYFMGGVVINFMGIWGAMNFPEKFKYWLKEPVSWRFTQDLTSDNDETINNKHGQHGNICIYIYIYNMIWYSQWKEMCAFTHLLYLKKWSPLISHVQTLVSWKHQVWRMVLLAGIATFRRRWLWKRSHQEKGLQSQSQRWPHWRRVPGIFFLGGCLSTFTWVIKCPHWTSPNHWVYGL